MNDDKIRELVIELKRVIECANKLIAAVDTENSVSPKTGETYVQERITSIVKRACEKKPLIERGQLIQRVCARRGILACTAIEGITSLVAIGEIVETHTERGSFAYSMPKK